MQAWVSFGNELYIKGLSVSQIFVSSGQSFAVDTFHVDHVTVSWRADGFNRRP